MCEVHIWYLIYLRISQSAVASASRSAAAETPVHAPSVEPVGEKSCARCYSFAAEGIAPCNNEANLAWLEAITLVLLDVDCKTKIWLVRAIVSWSKARSIRTTSSRLDKVFHGFPVTEFSERRPCIAKKFRDFSPICQFGDSTVALGPKTTFESQKCVMNPLHLSRIKTKVSNRRRKFRYNSNLSISCSLHLYILQYLV